MTLRDMRVPDQEAESVLSIVEEAEFKLTPRACIKEIQARLNIPAMAAKKTIKQLISDRHLCYQYHFGATYLEKSFLRPVKISPHFVLTPFSNAHTHESSGRIEIVIEPGISFGSGHHPTTQLCLQAMDWALLEKRSFSLHEILYSADIGTGSGVLALALCRAGMSQCNAYEIDPVSVNEARKNVKHNGLENQIQVLDTLMTQKESHYAVICANLRFPTLKNISEMIYSSLIDKGLVVLSGVRIWEKKDLIRQYERLGFELVWQADLKNWSAFVFNKAT